MIADDNTLYIVDGMGLIFTSFYSHDRYMLNKKGNDVSAIIGTIVSLNNYLNSIAPEHVVIVFDPPGGSFRNEIYPEYKANRNEADPQIIQQIPLIQNLLELMGFKTVCIPGFEADDVIGSIAKKFANEGTKVLIESKDKDFVQLVSSNIHLVETAKGKYHDITNATLKLVKDSSEEFPIRYTIDFLAICGDTADNIPGVRGLGAKAASALLRNYNGLEDIYRHIDEDNFTLSAAGKSAKTFIKTLQTYRDEAFLSYKLATIKTDVELPADLTMNTMVVSQPQVSKILELCNEEGLNRIKSTFLANRLYITNHCHPELAGELEELNQQFLKEKEAQDEGLKTSYKSMSKYATKKAPVAKKTKDEIASESLPALTAEQEATIKEELSLSQAFPAELVADLKTRLEVQTENYLLQGDRFERILALVEPYGEYQLEYQTLAKAEGETLSPAAQTLLQSGVFDELFASVNPTRVEASEFKVATATLPEFSQDLTPELSARQQADVVGIVFQEHPLTQQPLYFGLSFTNLVSGWQPATKFADLEKPAVESVNSIYLDFTPMELKGIFTPSSVLYRAFLELVREFIFKPLAFTSHQQLPTSFTQALDFPAEYQELEQQLTSLEQAREQFWQKHSTKRRLVVYALKDFCHRLNLTPSELFLLGNEVHDVELLWYSQSSNHPTERKSETLVKSLLKTFLDVDSGELKFLKSKTEFTDIIETLNQFTFCLGYLFAGFSRMLNSELYRKVEQPLAKYLFTMEHAGIKTDYQRLTDLASSFEEKLKDCADNAYRIVGREFKITSSKEKAAILFDEFGFPDLSGKRSTAKEYLQDLNHPLAKFLQDYSQLHTNLTSHVLPLLEYASKDAEHKVYSTFQQTRAVTGRLSSTEPNLQNVPVREEYSKEIRASFIAQPGYQIVSLDYSQIELRILAYLSLEDHMIDSFAQGLDIHAQTATKLFNVVINEVAYEQRQIAKAINFGLNYGKEAFSLAEELNIERSEAKRYIDEYFNTYPKIRNYMDSVKAEAQRAGYVKTISGRVITLPKVSDKSFHARKAELRNAMNYPIQGSAAEVIKVAMNNIYRVCALLNQLGSNDLIAHLQVHDELLFSVSEAKAEYYIPLLKHIMETSFNLSPVVLKVDYSSGAYWKK